MRSASTAQILSVCFFNHLYNIRTILTSSQKRTFSISSKHQHKSVSQNNFMLNRVEKLSSLKTYILSKYELIKYRLYQDRYKWGLKMLIIMKYQIQIIDKGGYRILLEI